MCVYQQEIARTLTESKADVHVDPMLHKACVSDIKRYCYDVPPGEGRRK
jgi:Golgi apparatus protein 1